jgi:hypothetical protein
MAEVVPNITNTDYTAPAVVGITVTASDSTDLKITRGLYVGVAGAVHVRFVGQPNETIIFTAVPAGTILPISVNRVMNATTATGIIALH